MSTTENPSAALCAALEATSIALALTVQAVSQLAKDRAFVANLEPAFGVLKTATCAEPAPRANPCRFERVAEDGSVVLNGGIAVVDHKLGLEWSLSSPERMNYAAAEKWAAEQFSGEGRLPTLDELESLRDLTRYDPAINPIFSDTQSSAYWTSTPAADSPEYCAWVVNFYLGDSYWNARHYDAFVRAVRSVARASQ